MHARAVMYVDAFVATGWGDAEAVGVREKIPRMGERSDAEAVGVRDGISRMGERNDTEAVGVRDGIPRMGEQNVIDGMSHRTETDWLVIDLHHVVGMIAVDEQQHVDVKDVGNVRLHEEYNRHARVGHACEGYELEGQYPYIR